MTNATDIIYCARDRRAFTALSFSMLLRNTDWSRVRRLHVYDDGSTDGTRELLERLARECPIEYELHDVNFQSSVGALNHYVERADSERFAKIDNDIMVPPGWNVALGETMDAHPDVELLGMEGGRISVPPDGFEGPYEIEPARWIGGVGMMQTRTLGVRPSVPQNGTYFGFTEWQREYGAVVKAWIKPDLLITELSRIPFEPWRSISDRYREKEIERPWPRYHEEWSAPYWSWWPADHARYAELR